MALSALVLGGPPLVAGQLSACDTVTVVPRMVACLRRAHKNLPKLQRLDARRAPPMKRYPVVCVCGFGVDGYVEAAIALFCANVA